MGKRLTPETKEKTQRTYVTVNMRRADYARLRAIADAEEAPIHKVVTGLLNYYEENEK